MPVPGKMMTPIGMTANIWSLRLNGAALACFVQSGLKATCGTLRVSAQRAAIFRAFWASTVHQHHVGVLYADLIELGPDELVIGAVAAGEGDFRSCRQQNFGLGPTLGGDEVAAVDHRGGHVAMVDPGASARFPARSGLALEVVGGLVAHQFEGVAAFDQGLALGEETLQFDGFDLAAILLALAAALRLLVVVEFALDPVGGAVEEIDGRPEEIVEVGFKARVCQGGDQGVEDVGDGAGDAAAFGKRPGIGFVSEGAIAVELKLLQNMLGRGRVVVRFEVVVPAHGMLRRLDRDHRGLLATKAHGRHGPAPGAKRRAEAERRMAKAGYFGSRWKAALPAAGK